jgi:hypothetical protein
MFDSGNKLFSHLKLHPNCKKDCSKEIIFEKHIIYYSNRLNWTWIEGDSNGDHNYRI